MSNWRFVHWSARALAALLLTIPPAAAHAANVYVPAGGNLQAAINAARPGDTILLEPGATFVGNFKLPAHGGSMYVTIRSAAGDHELPRPGERISPAHAPVLAALRSSNTAPVLTVPAGSSYWHLQFLEFRGNLSSSGDILRIGSHTETQPANQTHHVVLDRVYVHGDPVKGHKNGIVAHASHFELRDSYVSDIKLYGTETHALISYNGPGPYTIENNYLEASGINVMFGGADPTNAAMIPSDITFRFNHVAKNLAWMTPRADGTYWTVKNLFELKVGRRVHISGNLFENNWTGAGDQPGSAILFRTENQSGVCGWCETGDVRFENNIVRHSSAAFSVVGLDYPGGGVALGVRLHHVTIRNNLFDDIDSDWLVNGRRGSGKVVSVSGVDNFVIDHNTFVLGTQTSFLYFNGSYDTAPFVYTNNMSEMKTYGIKGDGTAVGTGSLIGYTASYTVTANVLAGGKASSYPAGNFVPTVATWQTQFVDYAAGDYRLNDASVYRGAGTDGKDLGVDMAELLAAFEQPAIVPVEIVTANLPAAVATQSFAATLQATGGTGVYTWVAGALPAGLSLSTDGIVSGTPATDGEKTFGVTVLDGTEGLRRASRTLTLTVEAPPNYPPAVALTAPIASAVVGASVAFAADASDVDGSVARVEFFVNGASVGSSAATPFSAHWQAVTAGRHTVMARATDDKGATADSAMQFDVIEPEEPNAIVIYAAQVRRVVGDFQLVQDATAAAGLRLWNPNRNVAKVPVAAAPAHYAEFTFYAEAGRPYHLWLRGSAERNSYNNDSVWVQFSNVPAASIGTTAAISVILEDTSGAGVSGWGWQDNGYGVGVQAAPVVFATSGLQTIRILPREDGLSIDQIVLSPAYPSARPGALKNDTTILRPTELEVVLSASKVSRIVGDFQLVAAAETADGHGLWNPNRGVAKVALSLEPASYAEYTFFAVAGRPYHLWLRALAERNNYYNDSVYVQFSNVSSAAIGTTGSTSVMLEDRSGAGLAGWGWQDNGFAGPGTPIVFDADGVQTIRIQPREDGLTIDQIVRSPSMYLDASPGALKNDTTILPQ